MDSVAVSPRVFVLQDDGTKNLVPAMQFGSLEIMLSGRISTYATAPIIDAIKRALKTFTPHDYLLLIGDPLAIGAATAYASYKNGGIVKVLKWDRQERTYYALTMDLGLMKDAS